ncbi:hypothetical protein PHJA_000727300 [Phtheirospermum japonicum]|uniref:At4g14310 8-bladed propeller domain-containing protein n=1 Tax=Phtheirospermum japonicum TaxID=374723 RepID=A0A830BPT3_9LAMI|nr:hypothetical protein PHJA_000727300 [Phtheirospermum japonicum]
MSTSSVRRLKERGGGAKVAAPPTGKVTPVAGKSVSTGKEISRPTSQPRSTTQKPSIRPMARIDKSAVAPAGEEPHSRWSSSSAPRGRRSSPSGFTTVLSDLRKNSSRVSLGPPQRQVNGVKMEGLNEFSSVKPDLEKRGLKELERGFQFQEEEKVKIRVGNNRIRDITKGSLCSVPPERPEELEGNFQEKEKINNRVQNGSCDNREPNLNSISEKRMELENFNQKSSIEFFDLKNSNFFEEVKMKTLSSSESTMVSKVSNLPGVIKENVANKYPSKLHEKLAFLDGKVKKIASDINRTKEMLDLNNPDSSKIILSDIQEKITGIEKAMVHVGKERDARTELVKIRENKEKTEDMEVVNPKISVKGLSDEELEARLFPHHALMRDRTLSKTTSRDSEMNVKGKKVSSLDENEIALEFLASLSIEESRVDPKECKFQKTGEAMSSVAENSSLTALYSKANIDALLMADEKLYEFDDQEIEPSMIFDEEHEEDNMYKLNDIGCKTSTGGWFVSEEESVLLAHDDGSCSFYDIANCEKKAEYKPPAGISPNTWRDCWIIRAPSADGCLSKYVVAASAGKNSVGPGFCSWDFYTKDIRAFHFEDQTTRARTALAPLSNNIMTVQIYDIRDGEQVMEWELQKPVLAMDYASPLHWINRGKVAIAESDAISLWDVNSLSSQALLSVSSSGCKISALHVNNADAELGGGVRQRISSVEAEGNNGVFCTPNSINVLDFRHPSGIGLKIRNAGAANVQSVFSRGDSIYIGCSSIIRSAAKKQYSSQIQQFSLRAQRLFSSYALPESNAHDGLRALAQVWGNSSHVMGVCGLGLFAFDALEDDGLVSFTAGYGCVQDASETIGPDDMCCPSFDYLASRVLLVSKDCPARWRYL